MDRAVSTFDNSADGHGFQFFDKKQDAGNEIPNIITKIPAYAEKYKIIAGSSNITIIRIVLGRFSTAIKKAQYF